MKNWRAGRCLGLDGMKRFAMIGKNLHFVNDADGDFFVGKICFITNDRGNGGGRWKETIDRGGMGWAERLNRFHY